MCLLMSSFPQHEMVFKTDINRHMLELHPVKYNLKFNKIQYKTIKYNTIQYTDAFVFEIFNSTGFSSNMFLSLTDVGGLQRSHGVRMHSLALHVRLRHCHQVAHKLVIARRYHLLEVLRTQEENTRIIFEFEIVFF